jgi:uncharacterized protein YlxP (DUF503 family)
LPILVCSLELYLPYCHSLKEKRKVIKSTADRLRSRFGVSVAELDHQDLWQRGHLGAVAIGSSWGVLEQLSDKLVRESERLLGGDLVGCTTEIIDHK